MLAIVAGCMQSANVHALDLDMARFASAKEAQARELAATLTNKVPEIVWNFFDAVRVDDWETATNLSARINEASGRFHPVSKTEFAFPALSTAIWQPISETSGAYDQFHNWDGKWLHWFGSNIVFSIPRGSVYFGGTDPGRFVISALCESHQKAKPFFTLTQNQLVDGGYLDYLRTMYGDTIRVPTTNDAHKAFEDYLEDAGRRLKLGKLKPGEDVRRTGEGRIQVSGQVAVMQINGLLARMIVEKNPDREFFVEESFPLDWMYPQLSPHGLIMRLHRDPLSRLNYETVRKDQDEWKRFVAGMIGDWINESTTMEDICNFTERVYLQKDYQGFEGDRAYADNMEAQKTFSKLRSSIAGLYVWRMKHAGDESEKAQMQQAADLALRQAIALCPHSPEAVFRSSEFLLHLNRTEDAIRTVRTAVRLEPNDVSFQDFLKELHKRY